MSTLTRRDSTRCSAPNIKKSFECVRHFPHPFPFRSTGLQNRLRVGYVYHAATRVRARVAPKPPTPAFQIALVFGPKMPDFCDAIGEAGSRFPKKSVGFGPANISPS